MMTIVIVGDEDEIGQDHMTLQSEVGLAILVRVIIGPGRLPAVIDQMNAQNQETRNHHEKSIDLDHVTIKHLDVIATGQNHVTIFNHQMKTKLIDHDQETHRLGGGIAMKHLVLHQHVTMKHDRVHETVKKQHLDLVDQFHLLITYLRHPGFLLLINLTCLNHLQVCELHLCQYQFLNKV